LVVQPFASDSDPNTNDGVAAVHQFLPSALTPYDPSIEGAVAVFFYQEDEINPSSFGQGNAAGPAVFQDGAVYVAHTHLTGTNSAWEHHEFAWLWPSFFLPHRSGRRHAVGLLAASGPVGNRLSV